jgi:hypothetical protein
VADEDKLVKVMEKGFDTLADLIGQTNERLDATRRELGDEIRRTNERLDATRRELGDEIRGTNARIENLIETSGGETRALREDLDALKVRVDALEKKAS